MAAINYDVALEIPKGVTVSVQENLVTVKGVKGEIKRKFESPRIIMKVEGNKFDLKCVSKKTALNDKMMINTFAAHLVNMFKGVLEGYTAKVKVLSGHFPMTATLEGGNTIVVKNFLGEKVPRRVTLMPGVKTVVAGDIITIDGADREAVAQSAAKIENLTRITNKDRRVFQDGCYIIQKAGNKKL